MSGAKSTHDSKGQGGVQENHRFALTALTILFFMWGFITCLNDILVPHLKAVFDLSYTQAMLVQFAFFGAYFTISLPAGALVRRIGFKYGIVCGLLVAALGCLLFYPAAEVQTYPLFLGALFVLASGVTLLQVSANPYVTALGDPATASSRLTLTQGFNALGTTLAPFFGGALILSTAVTALPDPSHSAKSVQLPYLILAGTLVLLAVTFYLLKLPRVLPEYTGKVVGEKSIWSHRHLVLGALGIFLYVGAEVAIGSFMVNFLGLPEVMGMEEAQAANYIAIYWAGAMVGRFIGAFVMRVVPPGTVLAVNGVAAIVLILVAMFTNGAVAMWSLLLVGLCNSIMFPTIFSLALRGMGVQSGQASGLLCLAIVGGALVPLLQGVLADAIGLHHSYFIPVMCYLYIVYYGVLGWRAESPSARKSGS
ncbi:sugar MFS transporter [Microbulbifer agarilyticus]|uniref:sugar MFS transporter n=1 Tax=Microbulbifer agarilyticus TaxID=260552 RepID=UPI001CD75DEA|nr:sugar MFS transporter [Microbulbifer agarilyticus]MCA0893069.1 sugar MFS transporter [Microbulbifer agarilyticus]